VIRGAGRGEPLRKQTISVFQNLTLDKILIFRNIAAMQYFVVMIDYGRRGREAIVDPEITRREVVSRVASGEYNNISFIHEIADGLAEDITAEILAEAGLPEIALTEIPATAADLQAERFDHERDLRKHERV
jgi:hypothetical protein